MTGPVGRWFADARAEVGRSPFVSIALDQLVGPAQGSDWTVSAECFSELIRSAESQSEELMPVLVWPLTVSKLLTIRPATIGEAQTERSEFEPPTLYLRNRRLSLVMERVEEYIRPLEQELIFPVSGVVSCFYRTYRDDLAIKHDWDYYRAIYFEWYPSSLAPRDAAT